jgi:hypothetical protein
MGLLSAACAALLFAATSAASAMRIAPPAPATRAAMAHTIVVGKVESIEEKTVSALPFPGAKDKVEYQIAVIKVEDPILGAKGLTHVRVGFIPPPPPPMGKPGGPIAIGPRNYNLTFAKDQQGMFFLTPHGDGNFMIAATYNDFVNKQGNPNFDKEVTETKNLVKILANPKESLKAEKSEDRFIAASMLVTQYRTNRLGTPQPKTEAVDAEISKLILTALAETDWKAQIGPGVFRLNAQGTFMQLGVTEKDGFNPPTIELMGRKQIDYTKYADYAKEWCKDNAGKYKIQRFVHEEKKDKSDK